MKAGLKSGRWLGLASVGVMSCAAWGQHEDFQLINDGSGRIKSGLIDLSQVDDQNPCPVVDDDFRVYTARLDEGSFPHFANFPGFNACNDTFSPGSLVGFNLIDALRRWDGEDFDEIPEQETMIVSSGGGDPILVETPAEAGGFAAGFDMTDAADDGSIHVHVQYFLTSDEGEPEPGVYLLTLEVTSTTSGLEPSEPLYVVFGDGAPQSEVDAASSFVRDRIDCPADVDGDGALGSDDFLAYLDLFAAGEPGADFDGDGMIGSADFLAFLDAFAGGCS